MENLLFSLNATIPIFLLMVVGYFLNKINVLDDVLVSKLNAFVFKVSLPLLLFVD
ncbi:AEC family transporter, partial [uncultured Holdemanella sp.]|uniref:AEC family transporter n=1 Tax=uncultured Holdemanella sp. TaxID=1763549 RepID=UPI0025DFEDA4